jgi:hypothetical protein
MTHDLLVVLKTHLAKSMSEQRKYWAQEIVDKDISLESLFSLWHGDRKTAQRFMWLVGDLSSLAPDRVTPCMPFLFALRDEMPFPGMHRSVAKWLCDTNVPEEIRSDATKQLFRWLKDADEEIGVKHYATKVLLNLSQQGHFSLSRLKTALKTEAWHPNAAYRTRVQKLVDSL